MCSSETGLSLCIFHSDNKQAKHHVVCCVRFVVVYAVERRVRSAMGKKDESINSLREALSTAELRIRQSEALLDKQRKELLG